MLDSAYLTSSETSSALLIYIIYRTFIEHNEDFHDMSFES